MPTIEVSADDLLNAIKQMTPADFDQFLERALALRAQSQARTLSPQESKLIQRINRGLPAEVSKRYSRLTRRRKKGTLTAEEHQELLQLTHEAENLDAERAAALLELARLRGVPIRMLMKQMGIKPQENRG